MTLSILETRQKQLCKEILYYASINDSEGMESAKLKLSELKLDDCRTCLFYSSKFAVGFSEYGPMCKTCEDWSNYRRQPRLTDFKGVKTT